MDYVGGGQDGCVTRDLRLIALLLTMVREGPKPLPLTGGNNLVRSSPRSSRHPFTFQSSFCRPSFHPLAPHNLFLPPSPPYQAQEFVLSSGGNHLIQIAEEVYPNRVKTGAPGDANSDWVVS